MDAYPGVETTANYDRLLEDHEVDVLRVLNASQQSLEQDGKPVALTEVTI